MQMSFAEILEQEKRRQEHKLPGFMQTESAPLVKYTGESKTGLPNGALGFIVGTGFGMSNNTIFQWRSARKEVSFLDLTPMKVTEFKGEEKEVRYPGHFELVEIVANKNMKVIDKGYLTRLMPDAFSIKDRDESGRFIGERHYDSRVHHFKGYEPSRLLVWRDEYEPNG